MSRFETLETLETLEMLRRWDVGMRTDFVLTWFDCLR